MRLRKNKFNYHLFTASEDSRGAVGVCVLIGGPRPYLSVRTDPAKRIGAGHASFSGSVALRKLARAILKATAKKGRKRG